MFDKKFEFDDTFLLHYVPVNDIFIFGTAKGI